jgi:hypothetical protein
MLIQEHREDQDARQDTAEWCLACYLANPIQNGPPS